MGTFTQWQYSGDSMGQATGGTNGTASKTFPLQGNGPEPWFRDKLDAVRSARIPTAEYPDGYLGTTRGRREDRLRAAQGKTRLTQRSYQRGVHVGARVDPQSYFWDDDIVSPMAGIQAQARGERWAPLMDEAYQLVHPAGVTQVVNSTKLTNDGKPMPRGAGSLNFDPGRTRFDERLRPRWK